MSELRIVNETCIGVNNIHWTNIDPIIVREIKKLLEENQQLEETLLDIKKLINNKAPDISVFSLNGKEKEKILKKIDKVLGGSNDS